MDQNTYGSTFLSIFPWGQEIVEELEENTGYHHPLSDRTQDDISELPKPDPDAKFKIILIITAIVVSVGVAIFVNLVINR